MLKELTSAEEAKANRSLTRALNEAAQPIDTAPD
jgi:hypothetical protein